jgi:hypothetical protein
MMRLLKPGSVLMPVGLQTARYWRAGWQPGPSCVRPVSYIALSMRACCCHSKAYVVWQALHSPGQSYVVYAAPPVGSSRSNVVVQACYAHI